MAPKQPVAGPSRIKASSSQSPPPPPAVSAFNASGSFYACAQPVLGSADKVSVWDINTDRVIAELELDASKATSLTWSSVSGSGPSKKKRRKSETTNGSEEALIISTSLGSVVAFSPKRSERIRQIEVGQVTAATSSSQGSLFATAKELVFVDINFNNTSTRFEHGSTAPITALSILPTSSPENLHVLLGSTSSIVSLHLDLSTSKVTHTSPPLPVSTTHVTALYPLPISKSGCSFLVVSHDDRTVSQYTLPSPSALAKLSYRYAAPTPSPVHSCSLNPSHLSVLHYSGEISLFPLPTELDLARPKSGQSSTIKVVYGQDSRLATLCGAVFVDDGALACGRSLGGGRVKWVRAAYESPDGSIQSETVVKSDGQDLVSSANQSDVPTQRFVAPTPLEVPAEDDGEPAAALPADVDMADLTLGERLLAMPNGDANPESAPPTTGPTNAASLTRLLVQALHTSDPALLNLVLTHRDPILIRNTIRKMPPTLALPLLKACIERLGQGKGAHSRGGGRGAAQNEQQARGTIQWVKGVLIERGSLLMTMPSLSISLAQLSNLLQERMKLYQPLQSLSGRLDLALSQIEIRRLAEAQASQAQGKGEGYHYIEGQSDSDSDDEVRVEVGDGDGEVEDVDMRVNGVDSDDDEEEEEEDALESGSDEDDDFDIDGDDGDEDSDGSVEYDD
ncbi:hypothetical protein BD324DRAFT_575830 [Kockovaella imperatae]|uniref:Small-subunit processome Utp12 domain-containing protein n=1 Tax=Kockovaella imperatae TaxID=4999 RepID=A0A1Y1UNQ9_9TREE|nr:hypothetical protein BD324DRAFT_575830 [Kockovaella imperatae]ORX39680.1 hypothetical protein BD324DRAFT_575830 [Kockovaella imperatae]